MNIVAWCSSQGFLGDHVVPDYFPDTGRGMKAVTDIEAGTVVLRVPQRLLFVSHRIAVSKTFGLLCNKVGSIRASELLRRCCTKTTALTVLLLAIKLGHDKSEVWEPFVQSLPKYFTRLDTWDDPETEALPKRLQELSAHLRSKTRSSFQRLKAALFSKHPDIFPEEAFNEAEWRWATNCISTRACFVNESEVQCSFMPDTLESSLRPPAGPGARIEFEGKSPGALVPYLDIFNHAHEPVAECYFADGAYCVKVTKAYLAGEQVFIHYGSHGNEALLKHWGFASLDNPHTNTAVRLAIDRLPLHPAPNIINTSVVLAPPQDNVGDTEHLLETVSPTRSPARRGAKGETGKEAASSPPTVHLSMTSQLQAWLQMVANSLQDYTLKEADVMSVRDAYGDLLRAYGLMQPPRTVKLYPIGHSVVAPDRDTAGKLMPVGFMGEEENNLGGDAEPVEELRGSPTTMVHTVSETEHRSSESSGSESTCASQVGEAGPGVVGRQSIPWLMDTLYYLLQLAGVCDEQHPVYGMVHHYRGQLLVDGATRVQARPILSQLEIDAPSSDQHAMRTRLRSPAPPSGLAEAKFCAPDDDSEEGGGRMPSPMGGEGDSEEGGGRVPSPTDESDLAPTIPPPRHRHRRSGNIGSVLDLLSEVLPNAPTRPPSPISRPPPPPAPRPVPPPPRAPRPSDSLLPDEIDFSIRAFLRLYGFYVTTEQRAGRSAVCPDSIAGDSRPGRHSTKSHRRGGTGSGGSKCAGGCDGPATGVGSDGVASLTNRQNMPLRSILRRPGIPQPKRLATAPVGPPPPPGISPVVTPNALGAELSRINSPGPVNSTPPRRLRFWLHGTAETPGDITRRICNDEPLNAASEEFARRLLAKSVADQLLRMLASHVDIEATLLTYVAALRALQQGGSETDGLPRPDPSNPWLTGQTPDPEAGRVGVDEREPEDKVVTQLVASSFVLQHVLSLLHALRMLGYSWSAD